MIISFNSLVNTIVNRISILILSVCLMGCDGLMDSRLPGEIPIHVEGIEPSACSPAISVGNDTWRLDFFGMYVSQPELRINGRWQPVSFHETEWQTNDLAMLVFTKNCDGDDGRRNTGLWLNASDKLMRRATNLRFTIGLPFAENHGVKPVSKNVLNNEAFFLSAQQGHAFLKLDLVNTKTNHSFNYHLGSHNCEAISPDDAPEKPCQFTNRVEVFLPTNQLDEQLDLELSLASLIAQVDLNRYPGCQFGSPEEPPCEQLVQNLLTRPWLKWEPIY